MKRLVLVTMFAAAFLLTSAAKAQDCSNWSNWDLRGTYTMSGSGFIDLSRVVPGAGLPSGLIPMTWVGAHTYNGAGGGTGWVSINAGGNQMNAQFVGLTYSAKANCSIQVTFSMKVAELGNLVVGPVTRLVVPAPMPAGLELHMILGGPAPGTPGGALDLGVSHRISMQY